MGGGGVGGASGLGPLAAAIGVGTSVSVGAACTTAVGGARVFVAVIVAVTGVLVAGVGVRSRMAATSASLGGR